MPKTSKSRKDSPRTRSAKGTPTRKPAKKARRGAASKGAASKKVNGRARRDTKQAILIEMLRRPNGATIEQMSAKTGWQAHSVRGAISGTLKKKLHLAVTSEKVEGSGRVYRITGGRWLPWRTPSRTGSPNWKPRAPRSWEPAGSRPSSARPQTGRAATCSCARSPMGSIAWYRSKLRKDHPNLLTDREAREKKGKKD